MIQKALLLTALMVVVPVASAADLTGRAIYRPVSSESVNFSDGRVLSRSTVIGFVSGDGADNPFDTMTQNCYSVSMSTPGSDVVEQFGHCDALDKDEDLFVLNFHNDSWEIAGGTGKFAGMKGGGNTKVIQTWSDGSYLITWTGKTSK